VKDLLLEDLLLCLLYVNIAHVQSVSSTSLDLTTVFTPMKVTTFQDYKVKAKQGDHLIPRRKGIAT
jgi:hypothetical protein